MGIRLLKPAQHGTAFAKVGTLGFSGTGKSWTTMKMIIGLLHKINGTRVAIQDTEAGSDFLIDHFKDAAIEPVVCRSRAFSDTLTIINECVENGVQALMIDTITHVWRDLCESYKKKLKRDRLQFQDWGIVKAEWARYTDQFISAPIHIFVCGRAGYEYDYDIDEQGHRDLVKTGTKMKVESEFGFEPSLVIEMQRISKNQEDFAALKSRQAKQNFRPEIGSQWFHIAHILKDRSDSIDGRSFKDPTYDDFAPHFEKLNIGGEHKGVDVTRDSQDRFTIPNRPAWKIRQEQKQIALEEIQNILATQWPSTTKDDKLWKLGMVKAMFGRSSWKYVETDVALELLDDSVVKLENLRAALKIADPSETEPIEERAIAVWDKLLHWNVRKPALRESPGAPHEPTPEKEKHEMPSSEEPPATEPAVETPAEEPPATELGSDPVTVTQQMMFNLAEAQGFKWVDVIKRIKKRFDRVPSQLTAEQRQEVYSFLTGKVEWKE